MSIQLISPSKVKKYAKEQLAKHRPKYTRVGQDLVEWADSMLRGALLLHIKSYTGPGKTLMAPGQTTVPPRVQNRFVREHVFNSITGTCKFCGAESADELIAETQCKRRKV